MRAGSRPPDWHRSPTGTPIASTAAGTPASIATGGSSDPTKANYAHAHVLLASSTALAAGHPGGGRRGRAGHDGHRETLLVRCRGLARSRTGTQPSPTSSHTAARTATCTRSRPTSWRATSPANTVWHARALAIASRLIDVHTRGTRLADPGALRRRMASAARLQPRPSRRSVPPVRVDTGPLIRVGPAAHRARSSAHRCTGLADRGRDRHCSTGRSTRAGRPMVIPDSCTRSTSTTARW